VYTHFYGTLYLLLQRRRDSGDPNDTQLDDCVLYVMVPGQSITIPPGYAHILINPSTAPGLMAGLYSTQSVHNYAPIKQMAGAGYYGIDLDGQPCFQPNPAYTHLPPLRTLTCLNGTPFEPPDRQAPLWQSFISDPDRYAFLYDPNLAKSRFAPEDLRL
jgi:glucose-6-phosphate isomerase